MDQRDEDIEEYLRGVREELFGGPVAPFSHDLPASIDWIESESETGRGEDFEQKLANFGKVFEKLTEQLIDCKETFPVGRSITVGVHVELVAFPGEEGWTRRVLATTPRLVRIAEAARYVAEYAGCQEGTATMALLAGTPIRTKLIRRKRIVANPVGVAKMLVIESSEAAAVKPAEIRDTWRSLTPRLKAKDLAFLDVVEELRKEGMPPPKSGRRGADTGIRGYWELFVDRWNRRHRPELAWTYGHWTSAQDQYQSILKRLPKTFDLL